MHTRQRRDRHSGIDVRHDPGGSVPGEVNFATCDTIETCVTWCRDVADIGEAFRPQQLLGHKLRGKADAGLLHNPEGGHFRRALDGERCTAAKDARGAGRRQAGQEIAARLSDLHRMPL
jgi:hypothetical protein